jgi:hypothetical protein
MWGWGVGSLSWPGEGLIYIGKGRHMKRVFVSAYSTYIYMYNGHIQYNEHIYNVYSKQKILYRYTCTVRAELDENLKGVIKEKIEMWRVIE